MRIGREEVLRYAWGPRYLRVCDLLDEEMRLVEERTALRRLVEERMRVLRMIEEDCREIHGR